MELGTTSIYRLQSLQLPRSSVTRPKPAPDLFLFAAKQIGLTPDRCVVVEDATVGVQAAIAAGMRSILVS